MAAGWAGTGVAGGMDSARGTGVAGGTGVAQSRHCADFVTISLLIGCETNIHPLYIVGKSAHIRSTEDWA